MGRGGQRTAGSGTASRWWGTAGATPRPWPVPTRVPVITVSGSACGPLPVTRRGKHGTRRPAPYLEIVKGAESLRTAGLSYTHRSHEAVLSQARVSSSKESLSSCY